MANYLTKLRTDPKYFHVKAQMETALERIPVAGNAMVKVLQGGKQLVRRGIYHSTMFEEMGFQYIGPVDGHDVLLMEQMFTNLQEQFAPIFLHVVTQKGKGLKPAEENPGEFHAVSSIDLSHLTDPEAVAQGFLLDGVRLHIGRDRRRCAGTLRHHGGHEVRHRPQLFQAPPQRAVL